MVHRMVWGMLHEVMVHTPEQIMSSSIIQTALKSVVVVVFVFVIIIIIVRIGLQWGCYSKRAVLLAVTPFESSRTYEKNTPLPSSGLKSKTLLPNYFLLAACSIFSSTVKMEAVCSSEHQCHHIQEDKTLHRCRCENVKCDKTLLVGFLFSAWEVFSEARRDRIWTKERIRRSYFKNYSVQ